MGKDGRWLGRVAYRGGEMGKLGETVLGGLRSRLTKY